MVYIYISGYCIEREDLDDDELLMKDEKEREGENKNKQQQEDRIILYIYICKVYIQLIIIRRNTIGKQKKVKLQQIYNIHNHKIQNE